MYALKGDEGGGVRGCNFLTFSLSLSIRYLFYLYRYIASCFLNLNFEGDIVNG